MRIVLISAAAALAAGCGSPVDVPVGGRVLFRGEPYRLQAEETPGVFFLEEPAGGVRTVYSYAGAVEEGGAFAVPGPERRGIPPGRYRVALGSSHAPKGARVTADAYWKAYDPDHSPFVVEVGRRGATDLK